MARSARPTYHLTRVGSCGCATRGQASAVLPHAQTLAANAQAGGGSRSHLSLTRGLLAHHLAQLNARDRLGERQRQRREAERPGSRPSPTSSTLPAERELVLFYVERYLLYELTTLHNIYWAASSRALGRAYGLRGWTERHVVYDPDDFE